MKHLMRSVLTFAAMITASNTFGADIAEQPTLTLEGARAIAQSAVAYARDHSAPGAAVAIVDAAGIVVYLERLDGTFQNASSISIGKARTAVLFGKPTRAFEDIVNKGRYTMLALPDIAPFTPLMGGVPVDIDGHIVGAIGVSGASSAAQDDEIATAAAAEFVKAHQQKTAQVHYVPRAAVENGFRNDATLVTDHRYRVNASRRDGPGQAEVHTTDTDIFYVLEGSAALITGGELVEPKNLSTTEIRGAAINGGQERHIAKGDVITIPRGLPHWFKQVTTPFTYYVVKTSG